MTNNLSLDIGHIATYLPEGAISLLQIMIIAFILLKQYQVFKRGMSQGRMENSLVMLGITGTFIGIIVGLFVFDPNDITNSISEFLGGMRIVFLTSASGNS